MIYIKDSVEKMFTNRKFRVVLKKKENSTMSMDEACGSYIGWMIQRNLEYL